MGDTKTYIVIMICFLLFTVGRTGYTAEAVSVPVDSDRWEFQKLGDSEVEHEVIDYQGQQSLSLRAGKAVLKDFSFPSGIIEFDIAFPQPEVPSFYGALWDVKSESEFVVWYIRPLRSSSEDDLTQVIPFYNDAGGWQLYWTDHIGHGPFNINDWNHVKVIVSGVSAEIYLNNMDTPMISVPDVKRNGSTTVSGSIGLKVYEESPKPAYYANFTYTVMDNPPMKKPPAHPKPTLGVVPEWMVSEPFPEDDVKEKRTLVESDRKNRNWDPLTTDHEGIANIGRLHGNDIKNNTIFTRTTILSSDHQVKKMTVGYSDWARVYLNGKLIFAGDNEIGRGANNFAGKRDYRFQGVMGYFDELYLPLQAGANEVWIAVTDARAGWGVEAMFENLDGITFDNTQQMNLDSSTPAGGDCTATYSLADGRVHIPCISVPNPSGGASVYEADIVQLPLAPGVYIVDENSIKPR